MRDGVRLAEAPKRARWRLNRIGLLSMEFGGFGFKAAILKATVSRLAARRSFL